MVQMLVTDGRGSACLLSSVFSRPGCCSMEEAGAGGQLHLRRGGSLAGLGEVVWVQMWASPVWGTQGGWKGEDVRAGGPPGDRAAN